MFTEEFPSGVRMVGIMLFGGTETLVFHEGKTHLHLSRHCFAHVYAEDPLALLPDESVVAGEIIRMEESCTFEFDENDLPVKIWSTYGYRRKPGDPLEYKTSSQEVMGKLQ
ncbi:hypothetical protein Oweho_3412 [Owenweeksia hongkongensis DSM 17368]|uniref:Uncharacterized protein n=1 Tax=Owenweeksia hongkongensis (strain DSM 17368 / CIP 108786 / JCM 12287 / NRRL B-23963 / UST20020801) TaxID=926562 RepID=G8R5P5_OWEHD|nr:hypothetical protein [Owenweeksia hongkongensis]AEV34361.1 hypothetical protein Oweho_3412 [Owenweeksia hongkongensis DSM 17368]